MEPMLWTSRFWLSKVRGWAAGALVASSAIVGSATVASAAESYFLQDDSAAPSASDVQPVTTPGKSVVPNYAPAACNTGCNQCGDCDDCRDRRGLLRGGSLCWPCGCSLADLGEAQKLLNTCRMQERGIAAGGWLAQSYVWNPYQPREKFNGPMTWTDRANEYQMNEAYGFVQKQINNDGCGFDWGYRADAFYGTNYRWDTEAGLESHINNGQFYGAAIPQFYGEVAYNDFTTKIGHFISPVGFYTVGTAQNFFPIIPYTYQYGEPFTHTGFLSNYKVDDETNIGGGMTHGWDNFDNSGNPSMAALLTASKTVGDDSLAWVGTYGREPNFSGQGFVAGPNTGFSTRYFQTLVYSHKYSDDVIAYLQSDFGVQGAALANGGTARWYGLNGYIYWNQTCRFQWGANAEWFRDEGGFRVGQVLPSFGSPNGRGYARGPGFDGSFYRLTFGPRYYWSPNFYTRAALAADLYQGKKAAGNNPFDDGQRTTQQVLIMDAVATF
jgi:hypothetical protein